MIYGINPLVLVFSALVLWCILLIAEVLKRRNIIKGENARKAIHIFSGFFLALLPVFANRREIVAVNAMFFVGVVLFAGILHRFSAIEDVKRWSLGQFLFPLGLILVAVLFKDPIVYSFATLELALADGFAAVFGHKYGNESRYRMLGATKSMLGSLIFFIITITIFYIYVDSYGQLDSISSAFLITGAIALTIVEGSVGAGFDNLLIPMLTATILTTL